MLLKKSNDLLIFYNPCMNFITSDFNILDDFGRCTEGATRLFRNDINVPKALHSCSVMILVFRRGYKAVP